MSSILFDKELFKRNADMATRRALSTHVDVIDGMTVVFTTENARFGEIPYYKVNGEKFRLYPVDRKWCSEAEPSTIVKESI